MHEPLVTLHYEFIFLFLKSYSHPVIQQVLDLSEFSAHWMKSAHVSFCKNECTFPSILGIWDGALGWAGSIYNTFLYGNVLGLPFYKFQVITELQKLDDSLPNQETFLSLNHILNSYLETWSRNKKWYEMSLKGL